MTTTPGAPSRLAQRVRLHVAADGTVERLETGADPGPNDRRLDGVVLPGAVNAHSHAFHRLLRGRTHQSSAAGDSFWTWRELMYTQASRLTPELYERVATAVYAEMAATGWTSVVEFHYVHHAPDGRPYGAEDGGPHAMELALARAARSAGVRLTLLDTVYLAGGFGLPLQPEQQRFSDGSAHAWVERLASLRDAVAERFDARQVRLGAALHSVRAVPPEALPEVAAGIDAVLGHDAPVHVHLSEQVAENEACLAATGLTPTGLLAEHALLSPRLSAVHATHLTDADIALLGAAGATVVMCPTTEADLGDGIGPARALADAGVTIALGTDQHAVVDPLLETRALEHGERLASRRRGRFSPADLTTAMTSGGRAASGGTIAGAAVGSLAVGEPCDFVVIDSRSTRTAGADPDQLVLCATASDVTEVLVGGRTVAAHGKHAQLGDPGALLARAVEDLR
ncbi:formimidoylglutamate deiminase [Quadrisphaera granulorum]|uniref:formimidoylglutamate deiminase n=1 Tax=Quadrisphaera granulorum TaxID=317664 RepID=UPI000D6D68A4|nr:formimidoylglutamate deiminase [Quadrisphaera granulorum]